MSELFYCILSSTNYIASNDRMTCDWRVWNIEESSPYQLTYYAGIFLEGLIMLLTVIKIMDFLKKLNGEKLVYNIKYNFH
jgi:hypothetical protein